MPSVSKILETLKEWQTAKAEVDFWKRREAELRQAVISQFSGWTDPLSEGTETVPLSAGLTLKIGHGVDYKLEGDIKAAQEKIASFDGDIIADRLISWKPQLVLSEYRKATPRAIRVLEKFIQRRARAKTLEIR